LTAKPRVFTRFVEPANGARFAFRLILRAADHLCVGSGSNRTNEYRPRNPQDRLLPLSCKGRSMCPSCCGRRMADTAAHLVDCVFPRVPARQWVLSLPFALRYRLAYDSEMVTAILEVFIRVFKPCAKPKSHCLNLRAPRAKPATSISKSRHKSGSAPFGRVSIFDGGL
jgi:hypothetical protein